MIIVDANLIGALFLQGDQSPLAAQTFEKDPDWYAPLLWQSEMRSLLASYLRHKLITLDKAVQIMDEAHELMRNMRDTFHQILFSSLSLPVNAHHMIVSMSLWQEK
jgi:hypothetical protein